MGKVDICFVVTSNHSHLPQIPKVKMFSDQIEIFLQVQVGSSQYISSGRRFQFFCTTIYVNSCHLVQSF